MNAVTSTLGKPSKPGAFKWLIKREFWENRGGFFWAPVITGGIFLVLNLILAVIGSIAARRSMDGGGFVIDDAPEKAHQIVGGIGDGMLLGGVILACVVLAFVVFFYALGTLYDDRRDRSVLFWKSLPVSDTATVLSKVVSAMLVAPLIALLVSTIAFALFLVVIGTWAALHGINPLPLLAASRPFSLFGRMLLTIPADAAWALPTIGWLLFWSAFVRSKPFLWAVILPVLIFVANTWIGALGLPNIDRSVLLNDVLARLLFGIVPGSWLGDGTFSWLGRNAAMLQSGSVLDNLAPATVYAKFATAPMWIGILAGAAMIGAAIWMRGRRIETAS